VTYKRARVHLTAAPASNLESTEANSINNITPNRVASSDRATIAELLLGPIHWREGLTGYANCPGRDLHTHPNRKKDCRVCIDGAPTIHCVHGSCSGAVEDANHRLRSAIGKTEYSKRSVARKPRTPTPQELERKGQAEQKERLIKRSRMSLTQIIA